MRRIDRAPLAEGREQADADIDGTVGHREDPAVAGEDVVASADVEVALDEVVTVALGAVVPADGEAHRIAPVAGVAEGAPEPRQRPVGHHRPRRLDDDVLAPVLAMDARSPQEAAVEQGRGGLGLAPDGGARLLGPLRDLHVEVLARHHAAVGREVRMVGGPVELEGDAVGPGPKAADAVVRLDLAGHPDVQQGADGARGEAVAADLLTGVALLLEHQHVMPDPGQVIGGRRAAGPPSDDDHVGLMSSGHARAPHRL